MELFEEIYTAFDSNPTIDVKFVEEFFGKLSHELKVKILTQTKKDEYLTLGLLAISKGLFDIFELLISIGKEIEIDVLKQKDLDSDRQASAIHYACWNKNNNENTSEWFIKNYDKFFNTSLNNTDIVDNSPFLYACFGGNIRIAKFLHSKGCQLKYNNKGHTPIIQAACAGHLDIIKWLISIGQSIGDRDHTGNTALLFAAWGGHLSTVQWLLENGSLINEINHLGHNVLLSAANSGNIEVIDWLIKEKGLSAKFHNSNGDTALLLAAFAGNCDLLKYLIDNGYSSFDEKNNDGFNAIMSASNGGSIEMIKFLIEKYHQSIKVLNSVNYTPLIMAACGGHFELVKFLISNNHSDINETTVEGDTALTLSCYYGHTEIAEWFLDNGCQIEKCNQNGLTPLISAVNGAHSDVCDMLIKRGANIHAYDIYHQTALLLATTRNCISTVQLLAAYGSNFNVKTKLEHTIFDLVQFNSPLDFWIKSN